MSNRFSVIIPVYNAEKTLRRCVDSLLPQMSDADEIILVNDGAKDGSGAICRDYAAEYQQIRYIEKENGGVSSARNAGLDAAQGRYVLFVDSDDYVPGSFFSDIDQELQTGDWDLIRFSYCVDNGRKQRIVSARPCLCRNRTDAFPRLIGDICNKALNSPWAKVYRREIIEREHIRFPLGASIAEDRAFNFKYSMFVTSYRVSPLVAYCLNTENEQSLSRKQRKDLSTQFSITGAYVRQAILQAEIPKQEKERYQQAYCFGLCRGIYKSAKQLRSEQRSWYQRQKALWRMCGEINQKHMKYPNSIYCRGIALPVQLRQVWLIDLAAKRLLRKQSS